MKRTVVVVDDEPIIRLDLCQMLEELDFQVVAEGADGFDAVEFCQQKHPDIVLLDLEMPIFDGMAAAETILTEELADCVVICTAFADEEFIRKAGNIGVSGYLVKPVEQRNLGPTLEIALAQSRRVSNYKEEAKEAERKIEENKIIERAKGRLAKEKDISELDAYREMQKTAMEKRVTLIAIAKAVLNQGAKQDEVMQAKKLLMRQKGLSEPEAYKFLSKVAARQKISIKEVATKVLDRGGIK